ncbi:MAG TPA: alpha/beta hydrolase [Acidimicrobiia bacterium]|nr:alpha/beta hydrolase [Acidimicrobiia bacterium]
MVTKRGRLWLSRGLAITLLVVAGALFAATWYYSGEIEGALFAARGSEPAADVVLLDADEDAVRIPSDPRTIQPGRWGLDFPDGYVEIGDVTDTGGVTTREILATQGSFTTGERAIWDRMAFASPEARGIDYREVLLDGPLGALPAWITSGDSSIWVIFVHGAGADRREALRALPIAIDLGHPTITLSYRNDEGAPASSSGRHGFGRNEWNDVEAAVEFAVASNASNVILVGFGTGGSIVSVFMSHSRLADRVDGLVLDAPVLDAGILVERIAREDKVPGFIVAWSRAMASFRFGVEWSALDHVDTASEVTIPVLVFHGAEDAYAPIGVSRTYADVLGDRATLVVVEGAGHGEAWNLDPDSYESALREFLEDLTEPPTGGDG